MDNSKKKEIIDALVKLKPVDCVHQISKIIPGWIVFYMRGYSPDYMATLGENFKLFTEAINTTPKGIVTVKDVPMNNNTTDETITLKFLICDFLTRNGFAVRRDTELFPCPNCGFAVPTKEWHAKISKKVSLPKWRDECIICFK
jgi:hypothetical protein